MEKRYSHNRKSRGVLDKKINGGNRLAKKKKRSKAEDKDESYLEETRSELLKCIGDICFTPEGGIVVKVDKDKNPECAKRVADYVLSGREVTFEVKKTVGVEVDDDE